MKIYLIRHGQTTSDVEDRYGGDYDDHLTSLGESQAKELAQKLKDKKIENIFASSRIRAQETANILNQILKVKITTVPELRERNLYGPLTGMVKADALLKHPDLVARLKNTDDTVEGAELLGVKKESHEIKIADCAYVEIETDGNKFEVISSEGIDILDTPVFI